MYRLSVVFMSVCPIFFPHQPYSGKESSSIGIENHSQAHQDSPGCTDKKA